jgi:hypothetical protein
MLPNQVIEGSAEQRRCSVPSSLRSAAPPHCQRWATMRCPRQTMCVKIKELIALLEADGWFQVRVRGAIGNSNIV